MYKNFCLTHNFCYQACTCYKLPALFDIVDKGASKAEHKSKTEAKKQSYDIAMHHARTPQV
jgi:hypothetical protein